MAIEVNPPPLLRIPRKFLEDPEIRAFIDQQNTIIFQLWNRTGGNVDFVSGSVDDVIKNTNAIDEIPIYSGFMAQIQFLQKSLDGLPEFTMDTEGFTMDSTEFTMDKVIA